MFSRRLNNCAAAPRTSHASATRGARVAALPTHSFADFDVLRVSSALRLESQPFRTGGYTRKHRSLPVERSPLLHNCNYTAKQRRQPRAVFGLRPLSAQDRYMLLATDNKQDDCEYAIFRSRHRGWRNLKAQRYRRHISNETICSFSKFLQKGCLICVPIRMCNRHQSTAEGIRLSDRTGRS